MVRSKTLRLAVVALLALGACGGDDDSAQPTTSSGTPSGELTVYSGRNEALVKPILDMFTADTGIAVKLRGGDSGALAAQLLTEGESSPADVFFSQDAGALGAVSRAELLEKLPDTVTSRVDAPFRAKDGTWVGISGRVRVVVYNPTLAPAPPTSIDDVIDPKWKGKIGYAPTNASWQSFVTALRVVRGEEEAKEWLQAFKANDPKSYQGNVQVRDAVNDGQIAIGLVNHYYLYEKIAEEGAGKVVAKNQFLANGDVGGLVNVAGAAVLSSSKNKSAANSLVEYLLSDKAQRYFAQETFEYPLVDSVPPAAEVPKLGDLNPPELDLSDLSGIEKTQALLREVGLLTA